jgi:hypothetical protein
MRYPPSFPSHTGAHVINTRLASRLVAPGAAREDEGKGKKQGRTQEEEEVKRKRIITPVWPGGGTSIRGRRTNGWERAQRKQCEHVWQGRGRRRGRQEGEEKGEEEEEEDGTTVSEGRVGGAGRRREVEMSALRENEEKRCGVDGAQGDLDLLSLPHMVELAALIPPSRPPPPSFTRSQAQPQPRHPSSQRRTASFPRRSAT